MRVRSAIDSPWKVKNELSRVCWLPFIRLYFEINSVTWNRGWRIFGLPIIQRYRGSTISIGTHLVMRNWLTSNPLGPNHRTILATRRSSATIIIGNHVGMTGTTVCAETSIVIGNRVRFGANSVVVDTDFHPLEVAERHATPLLGDSRPVVIEDDVFIGMSAILLKGAHIGAGSVIGAGSIVTGSVPPRVVAAGNPAVVVRKLKGYSDVIC